MRELVTTFQPFAAIAAVGGVLGLCCGLPVLLSLGVLGAVSGLSVSSWALITLGLALAALGGARWVRGRRSTTPETSSAPATHPGTPGTTPDRSMDPRKTHHL